MLSLCDDVCFCEQRRADRTAVQAGERIRKLPCFRERRLRGIVGVYDVWTGVWVKRMTWEGKTVATPGLLDTETHTHTNAFQLATSDQSDDGL
jgi:hypothetical protein